MGIRESLIVDWEDKTLRYQGKDMYIVKQFEYKNVEYLYALDLATVKNENIEVAFLYKKRDDVFAHVDDDDLFDELVIKAGAECVAQLMKEDIENLQKQGII